MNPIVTIAIVVTAIAGIVMFIRSRIAKEWVIQVTDIPNLISKLKSSTQPLAWAQIIADVGNSKDGGLALDYSVNNGVFEFNWCLLAPQNIADKGMLVDFLDTNGFGHTEIVAENGCPLIRVIGPGIETIANRILAEVYQVSGPLTLIGEGFEWP